MPGAQHRYCVMHLWRNFTKQWKDKELKNAVWACSRATTVVEFNKKMDRVKRKNLAAWTYLNKWPKNSWTKAYFTEFTKCDNICNNACEVFNAKILRYRGKPILTLLEEVRCYIMRTIANNKMKLNGHLGTLPPMQQRRLDIEKEESRKWTTTWTTDGEKYEVAIWDTRVGVDLLAQTCTCRFWQLSGMPCKHACAAIGWKNMRPEDHCHAWLTMGAYRSTYEFAIQPTNGPNYWEETPYLRPIPPKLKRKAGRPKKNRRRDSTEAPPSGTAPSGATRSAQAGNAQAGGRRTRIRRAFGEIRCSRCGLYGHNTRTCHHQGVALMPRNWVPPPPEENEGNDQGHQTEIDLSQTAPNEEPLSQPIAQV